MLAGELTVTEAARRHGVWLQTANRWRNRCVEAGRRRWRTPCRRPGGRGSLFERCERAEIEQLKLALAEATVQLRCWQRGADYVDHIPS